MPILLCLLAGSTVADELAARRGAVLFAGGWKSVAGTCADCHPGGNAGSPATRLPPALRGAALLARIPRAAILVAADEADRDGDGISGRPGTGRFGWKASQPDLARQIARAMTVDLGLVPHAADTDALLAYLAALRPPPTAAPAGAELFVAAGCAACHTPTYTIPSDPAVTGMTIERIAPFTDLLLHDLGPGLADPAGPDAAEWRTAPLWGLRRRTALLHDGRAADPRAAVLWHDGEAARSRDRFLALPASAQAQLLGFLAGL